MKLQPEQKEIVKKILEKGMNEKGVGCASPDVCKKMLEESKDWTDWDWAVLGMQVGVLPK